METGADSGAFEGSIATLLATATPENGVLETGDNPGDPDRRDTLTAVHSDFYGQSSDTARTEGSRVSFHDAAGNEVTAYATGDVAYLRVEDWNVDDPDAFESVTVNLGSLTSGDNEDLYLIETGKTSHVFEGSIELEDSATATLGDGRLQVQGGDEIGFVYFQVGGGAKVANADITAASVIFVDGDRLPTAEVLEGADAKVRVVSTADNADPGTAESLAIDFDSLYGGDAESLLLVETGADTGVFEGTIPVAYADGNPVTSGDGVVETATSGNPAQLPDRVTAAYGAASATATALGSRTAFIDAFGRDTELYAASDTVYLRVTDPTSDDPLVVGQVWADVIGAIDGEVVTLTETGLDTGVYEGSLPLGASGIPGDGVLQADVGETLGAAYYHQGGLGSSTDQATIAGSWTLFVDAAGAPAEVYLQASEAFVRVVDHPANFDPGAVDTTSVQLVAEISGDVETLSLTETGADTGAFEGTIDLAVGTGVPSPPRP